MKTVISAVQGESLRCNTSSLENSENSKLLDNDLCILHCNQTVKCYISTVGFATQNTLYAKKCTHSTEMSQDHRQGRPALKVVHRERNREGWELQQWLWSLGFSKKKKKKGTNSSKVVSNVFINSISKGFSSLRHKDWLALISLSQMLIVER